MSTAKISNFYALTLSPPFSHVAKATLHAKYSQAIIRWLRRFSKAYAVYPELQHNNARLHYHGVFRKDNDITYLKHYHDITKLGHVKIDPLRTEKDRLRWIIYIRKDTPLTAGVLFPSPIPILPTKPSRVSTKWGAACKATSLCDTLNTEGLTEVQNENTLDKCMVYF